MLDSAGRGFAFGDLIGEVFLGILDKQIDRGSLEDKEGEILWKLKHGKWNIHLWENWHVVYLT